MNNPETNLYWVKGFIIEATSQQDAEERYPEILKATEARWLAEYHQHLNSQSNQY
jgi:hypothetical protein